MMDNLKVVNLMELVSIIILKIIPTCMLCFMIIKRTIFIKKALTIQQTLFVIFMKITRFSNEIYPIHIKN